MDTNGHEIEMNHGIGCPNTRKGARREITSKITIRSKSWTESFHALNPTEGVGNL